MPVEPPPVLLTEAGGKLLMENGTDALLAEGSPPPITYGKPNRYVPIYHMRRRRQRARSR